MNAPWGSTRVTERTKFVVTPTAHSFAAVRMALHATQLPALVKVVVVADVQWLLVW